MYDSIFRRNSNQLSENKPVFFICNPSAKLAYLTTAGIINFFQGLPNDNFCRLTPFFPQF